MFVLIAAVAMVIVATVALARGEAASMAAARGKTSNRRTSGTPAEAPSRAAASEDLAWIRPANALQSR